MIKAKIKKKIEEKLIDVKELNLQCVPRISEKILVDNKAYKILDIIHKEGCIHIVIKEPANPFW